MNKRKRVVFAAVTGMFLLICAGFFVVNSLRKQEYPQQNVAGEVADDAEQEESELNKEQQAEPALAPDFTGTAWTTANVNLRKEADASGEILTVLIKGTEVKTSTEENGWMLAKSEDFVGYVSAQYLSSIQPSIETVQEREPVKAQVLQGQHRDPNHIVVVIDPGHQLHGDSTKEPNGPGSSVMKARVTSGTRGVSTGIAEYVMNLEVSLKLKTELENRGYTVYMTRSTHDVNISNKERAEYATAVQADIAVRIHGNGSTQATVHGAEVYGPSAANPYVSHLANASEKLGACILSEYCKATGFRNRGVRTSDTMTGINWSSVPVTILELGYMSNADEDIKMNDAVMQNNMAQGIANGIDSYFGL